MKFSKTNLILLLSLFITGISYSQQKADSAFQAFAVQKNEAMNNANLKSDINNYLQHWKEFNTEFNKLSNTDKEKYKDFIISLKYNLACTYAKIGQKQIAYDSLEHSGYTNYYHIIEDDDWKNCRQDKRFINFCNSIKKYSTLGILQACGKYTSEQKQLPVFTYQDSSNEHLAALRKKYNLDSIAGNGTDVFKMINLMHWVHNTIRHDGGNDNPKGDKNAESYISYCTKNNGSCNCRGLAIILNEVYLAEGFKSRYVTCMPKDSVFNDCHVINCVFSTSLNKWIWMDPTNDAYVMNEKGELLGIAEVRERLIKELPLIVNPDANWNHKNQETKSHYLDYYMAKNLYRIECVVNSAYNTETPESDKNRQFIQLIPSNLSYKKDAITKNKNGNPVFSVLYTTNANWFWQKP